MGTSIDATGGSLTDPERYFIYESIAIGLATRAVTCGAESAASGPRTPAVTSWESGRPELLTACGLQRPADDRPTRAGHPDPFLICRAAQLSAIAVLIKEGDQAGEEVTQLGGVSRRGSPVNALQFCKVVAAARIPFIRSFFVVPQTSRGA